MSAALKEAPLARILDVTDTEYFADPCEVPSLSKSIASTLLTRSALHAWSKHPKLGNQQEPPSKVKDEGHIIHALMLGAGAALDVIDAKNFTTKAAQELRDAAYEAGRVPVLKRHYEQHVIAARALLDNLAGYGIRFTGNSEVAIEWREPWCEDSVLCRGRLDHLILDELSATIYDVKKISQADEATCRRHLTEYGIDIQAAAYTSAVEKLRPDLVGRVKFFVCFCEIEPPYAVRPIELDGSGRWHGESRWRRAVNVWGACLRDDYWPGYTDTITSLGPMPWAITQEEILNGV